MKEILREETAFNGNVVRIEYEQFDLGGKYKIRYRRPTEFGFRFDSSWATLGEAVKYFDLMIKGGRR